MNNLIAAKAFVALTLGACSIVSCTDVNEMIEEEQQPSAPLAGSMTINAVIEADDTRATLGIPITDQQTGTTTYKIYWEDGDAIDVLPADQASDAPAKFTKTQTSATSATGTFVGTPNKTSSTGYWAVYPSVAPLPLTKVVEYEKGSYALSIATTGGFNRAENGSITPVLRMIGYVDNQNSTTTFYHVYSYIKLTTEFSCSSIVITGNNKYDKLSGRSYFRKVDGDIQVYEEGWNRSATLYGNSNELIQPGTYYMAVTPDTLPEGFTLTFKGIDGSGTELSKSTSQEVVLTRANILNLGSFSQQGLKKVDSPFNGKGTSSSPYLIETYAEFKKFIELLNSSNASSYNTKHYQLTADIVCSPSDYLDPIQDFRGHLDGNNHTIKDYAIKKDKKGDHGRSGLFDYVEDAVIENLNLVFAGFDDEEPLFGCPMPNASIWSFVTIPSELFKCDLVSSPFIREACGSTIQNCHISGTDNKNFKFKGSHICLGHDWIFGGLIGHITRSGVVRNCSSALNIEIWDWSSVYSPEHYLGGICGKVEAEDKNVFFDRCRNTGNLVAVNDDDCHLGGIIAYVYDGYSDDVDLYVTNCVNTGNITAGTTEDIWCDMNDDVVMGGIIGKLDSDGEDDTPSIYNCLNKGNLISYMSTHNKMSFVGGIIGWADIPLVSNEVRLYNCANYGKYEVKYDNDYRHPFVGNENYYNEDNKNIRNCENFRNDDGTLAPMQDIVKNLNAHVGSSHLPSGWTSYRYGCCSWTYLDIDFTTSAN